MKPKSFAVNIHHHAIQIEKGNRQIQSKKSPQQKVNKLLLLSFPLVATQLRSVSVLLLDDFARERQRLGSNEVFFSFCVFAMPFLDFTSLEFLVYQVILGSYAHCYLVSIVVVHSKFQQGIYFWKNRFSDKVALAS